MKAENVPDLQAALCSQDARGQQLLEAARHLAASLDVTEVLTRIAEGAREILAAYGVAIYRLEADGRTLTPVVAIEPPYEEEVLATPIDVETSFTGQAIKAKRGLVFNDALADDFGQQIPGTPEEKDERVIVAPFIVDGEVLGGMCVKRTGTPFTSEELALAETFGTFACTALRNARTHRDLSHEVEERKRAENALKESKRKIEELHEVAQRLQSCQDERAACDIIIEAADRFLSLRNWRLVDLDGLPFPSEPEPPGTGPKRASAPSEGKFRADGADRTRPGAAMPAEPNGRILVPVGDGVVFEASLRDDAHFSHEEEQILDLLLGHLAEALKRIRLQNELKEQAIRDPLTRVYNRRYLEQVLTREIKRSERHDRPIGFLMIDVNDFKEINDRFGHQAGDRVLQEVASLLINQLRETDVVVRYGGDEFLVILPEVGDEVEKIKRRTKESASSLNGRLEPVRMPIRLSIGVSSWDPGGQRSINDVLVEADERMYEDKGLVRRPETGR
jgi:diguanylate cyclase (GGDEF)-like protein